MPSCLQLLTRNPIFRGAYKIKKLAARDSHFLLNNFLINNFGVRNTVHWKATGRILGKFYHIFPAKNLEIMYPPYDLMLTWDNMRLLGHPRLDLDETRWKLFPGVSRSFLNSSGTKITAKNRNKLSSSSSSSTRTTTHKKKVFACHFGPRAV